MAEAKRKTKKKSKKKAKRKIQAYAFIDTNIFLDFYRASEATLSMLEKLERVRDRIICTYQVEMEFLKNRQRMIRKIATEVDFNLAAQLPAVLSDTTLDSYVTKTGRELKTKRKKLKSNLLKLLRHPKQDRVLTVFEQVFRSDSDHVLTRDMKQEKARIKRLARKRYQLGYAPRKPNDTSMGDAFNWEWIIDCASRMAGRFIIVSKDSDFGAVYEDEYFLNDQLKQEFRERVGNKSIAYTHKLSDALSELDVPVTKRERESEVNEVVRPRTFAAIHEMQEVAAQIAAFRNSFVHSGANFAGLVQRQKEINDQFSKLIVGLEEKRKRFDD